MQKYEELSEPQKKFLTNAAFCNFFRLYVQKDKIMKRIIYISLTLGILLLTACSKETDNFSTTHPIVGAWEYQSATCEVIHFGSGDIDTVFELGHNAPMKDMVFNDDGTAVIQFRNDAITFTWNTAFENYLGLELYYPDGTFFIWFQIYRINQDHLEFLSPGPADLDAQNQEWHHYTYRRK